MKKSSIAKPIIDLLRPKGRRGALPLISACPHCGTHMGKTAMQVHRTTCDKLAQHRPPQAAALDQDAGGRYNPDGTFPQT